MNKQVCYFSLTTFLILILLSCVSCDKKKQHNLVAKSKKIHVFPVIDKPIVSHLNYSSLNADVSYIQLLTPPNIIIGTVDEVLFNDDFLLILDIKSTNKVFQFKRDGSFIRTIGAQGKGPGEYLRVDDISINTDRKQIILFSQSERKVLAFSYDGELIKEERLTMAASEIQFIDKGTFVLFNHDIFNLPNEKIKENINYNIMFVDENFSKISLKYYLFNSHEGEGKSVMVTGRYFDGIGEKTTLNWRFNDTTYQLDAEGISPYVFIDFGNKKVVYNNYQESTANYIWPKVKDGTFYSLVKPTLIANDILFTKFIMADKKEKTSEDQFCYLLASLDSDSLLLVKQLEDDIFNGVFNFPVGTHQDDFISILYPEEYIDKINPGGNETYFRGTKSILKRYGNPILCLTKFKQF